MKYDAEEVSRAIIAYLVANLNTRITALNAEFNDDIVLKTLSDDAFFFQTMNDKVANYDPYCLLSLDDIQGEGIPSASSELLVFSCGIVLQDAGQDLSIGYRLLRYGRVLRELFNNGYSKILPHVTFTIQSLRPVVIPSPNSNDLFRAVGVQLMAPIA